MVSAVVFAVAVSAAGTPGTGTAAAADHPVLAVWTTPTLGCTIIHLDDPNLQFFNTIPPETGNSLPDVSAPACGTFLAVGSRVFGPARTPGMFMEPQFEGDTYEYPPKPDAFTPVSQSRVTGSGTTRNPFRLVTRVAAGDTGIIVMQTDTWSSTSETVKTRIDVFNRTRSRARTVLYRAGDCQEGTYFSFGRVRPGKAACIVADQDGIDHDIARLVPGGAIVQFAGVGATGEVGWGSLDPITRGEPMTGTCGTCEPDEPGDQRLAISWPVNLRAGRSATIRTTTTLSTGASRLPAELVGELDPSTPNTVTVRLIAEWGLGGGQTIRFLRDGAQVCSAVTDADGTATCDVTQDLGTADPAAAQLGGSMSVEVMFDGDLDLRPASTYVTLSDVLADPGVLPAPTCLPTESLYGISGSIPGTSRMDVSTVGPSCPTVRYTILNGDGTVAVYLPGDGTDHLRFEFGSSNIIGKFVAVRFRQPAIELFRADTAASSPGKARGG